MAAAEAFDFAAEFEVAVDAAVIEDAEAIDAGRLGGGRQKPRHPCLSWRELSQHSVRIVIPVQTGILHFQPVMDSRRSLPSWRRGRE